MFYEIRFTKEAVKDTKKLTLSRKKKLKEILQNRIAVAPFSGKKLTGDLSKFYSVRLSYSDRIVYSVDEESHIVYIHRTRTHYGE
jgi:mRNA-degrading endonuclease RelE of RelBE toxin-antitoxin system